MPNYEYKAKTAQGKKKVGEINAKSKAQARNLLANKGLRTLKLTPLAPKLNAEEKRTGLSRYIYRDKKGAIQIELTRSLPTTKELALFTKQFSMMIENGISIIQALELLQDQQRKESFAEIILTIKKSIEQGSNLSDALEPHTEIFDSLYIAMVRAGETSGKLDVILRQLVKYIEKNAKLKSQVKSALTYPSLIVLVSLGVISVLLIFVVPSFADQFQQSGQELPYLTQVVINISDWFIEKWHHALIGLILFIAVFRFTIQTKKGRIAFDAALLKAPALGNVMTKISIGRFCSTMSVMIGSGVSIIEALTICAESSGNKVVESFVFGVRDAISKGESFSDPLSESDLFPKMVTSMVAVGESTGTIDEALAKVTSIYEDEVDTAIAAMMSLIEPAMIVIIGSIVGFILIAMYLPIFDLASTVGG